MADRYANMNMPRIDEHENGSPEVRLSILFNSASAELLFTIALHARCGLVWVCFKVVAQKGNHLNAQYYPH